MSTLEFHPEQAVGTKLAKMDREELLQFVSRLCLHLKAEVGSRAYHGGIFPENICTDGEGHFAIGPAKLEKWSGQELEFVAPELYWNGKTSPAADVYSLALLVYYGLGEGKLPFDTASSSGQLSRMSGKALPAPKNAGKRLGEVLEKATSFQVADRYQTPEELQIMLESCMDNKYLGGVSGAEAVFRKEDEDLSVIERMMVDIIERSQEPSEDEEEELPPSENLSPEEQAGLEKPTVPPPEKEDVSAMVEEFFGSLGEIGALAPDPEEGEDVRVYEPARDRKDRQPIPILTEEKYPELAPVILPQQPRHARPEPPEPEEIEAEPEPMVRKRRNLRPLAVVLLLCTSLVAGALALNLYWRHSSRPTQLNPTPNPQSLYEDPATPAPVPEQPAEQTPQPQGVIQESALDLSTTDAQPRYLVTPGDASWTMAQSDCRAKGGHLAVISTRQEFDEITRQAEARGLICVWIGCHREKNQLVWETDEEIGFSHWAENEPSGYDRYDGTPEDYVMLYRVGDEWFYNDSRNDPAADFPDFYSGVMGYVCEFES